MEEIYIQITAIVSAVSFFAIAVFHVLLSLGLPLGEAAWGGSHKILPSKLRLASLISSIILLIAGLILLHQGKVVFISTDYILSRVIVWIFTAFLGLNTLGNFVSKSKKEKMIMTPISALALLSCLFVAVFS